MAKKKKKADKKPSIQEQLGLLCEMINRLGEKIAQLQLEIGSLRPPAQTPFAPKEIQPFRVTCRSPEAAMYMGRKDSRGEFGRTRKDG